MTYWKHAFNGAQAFSPHYWDDMFGGPIIYDVEAQRALPRRVSGLAKRAALGAKALQAIPVLIGVGSEKLRQKFFSGKRKKRDYPTVKEQPSKKSKVTLTAARKPFQKISKKKMTYGRRGYRKRVYRKRTRSRKVVKKKNPLPRAAFNKVVKSIERRIKKMNTTSPIQKYRTSNTTQITTANNSRIQYWVPWSNIGDSGYGLINIIDDTLPTINGSTVSWEDLSGLDSQAMVRSMPGSYLVTKFRNNNSFPCHVTIYECYCVDSTTITPVTEYQNIVNDKVYDDSAAPIKVVNPETSPLIKISQYLRSFKKWRVRKTKHVKIEPASSFTYVMYVKKREFDVAHYRKNSSTSTSLRNWDCGIMLDLIGVVAHDATTPTLIGYGGAKLDIVNERYINFNISNESYMRLTRLKPAYDTMAGAEIWEEDAEDIQLDDAT